MFIKSNQEYIESRCFYLNMFFKQLVRCPYLYESEEFQLFIRPQTLDLERALTYLPKMSVQKVLEKVLPFYSIMGDIDTPSLEPIAL